MIRSPLSSDEAFILEFRKKEGIFDNYIPGTGLVIYRVNLKNNHILIDDDDPVTCFYPYRDTSVNLRLGDGTYAGIEISNISLVGDTISFSVNISNQKNALYFKDIRVAQAISKEINKDIKNITEEDLTKISELYINPVDQFDLPIDLDGIDKLVSLQKITLERCKLNDISNLKGLKNLSELRLVDNNIENIESLRDLKSLKILTLRGNLINDYSPVSGYYNNLVEKDFSLL